MPSTIDAPKKNRPATPADADASASDSTPADTSEKPKQLALVDEPIPTPKLITALKLDTAEQVRSVALSIENRIADLNGLAKKNRELGKEDAAKQVEREVAMMRETLSPQLKSQGALAFDEGETLPQTVARIFQGEFRHRVRAALTKNVTVRPGEKAEDARLRQLDKLTDFEALIGNIGEVGGTLVVAWLTQVADRA